MIFPRTAEIHKQMQITSDHVAFLVVKIVVKPGTVQPPVIALSLYHTSVIHDNKNRSMDSNPCCGFPKNKYRQTTARRIVLLCGSAGDFVIIWMHQYRFGQALPV